MSNVLQQAYQRLYSAYGPQRWWPGNGPLEVAVGAILTQNTNWKNVEKALENLREADALGIHELHNLSHAELAELIRPAGYYRVKARRLKNLVAVVAEQFDGLLESLFQLSQHDLRQTLLAVNGIGPETADSIVLYAAELPVFVVDTYTARVVKRHGWIALEAGYYELQERFHDELDEDVVLYNEYHALLVRVGKQHCGTRPSCAGCPLADLLPADGPLEI
jgi:endonuclease-3 related protein